MVYPTGVAVLVEIFAYFLVFSLPDKHQHIYFGMAGVSAKKLQNFSQINVMERRMYNFRKKTENLKLDKYLNI